MLEALMLAVVAMNLVMLGFNIFWLEERRRDNRARAAAERAEAVASIARFNAIAAQRAAVLKESPHVCRHRRPRHC